MNRLVLGCSLLFLSLRIATNVHAQVPADIRDLKLRDWEAAIDAGVEDDERPEGEVPGRWTCTTTWAAGRRC